MQPLGKMEFEVLLEEQNILLPTLRNEKFLKWF